MWTILITSSEALYLQLSPSLLPSLKHMSGLFSYWENQLNLHSATGRNS